MRSRCTLLVRVLLAAVAVVCACGAGPQTAQDDWPRYGRDGALTARSPLRGDIAKPHVAWTYSVAGRELLLELTSAADEHRLTAQAGVAPAGAPVMPVAVPGPLNLDLDGGGTLRPAVETFHERWAKILPGTKGLQRVAWSHTWTDQKVCRLQLFAYDRGFGSPRLVWQSDPPEDTVFNPLNVVFDIDGDGVQEVCVAAHYRVMIFDGTTGRKETELRYHQSRPYGWFGLADIDADGQMELVTIGDFQSHIDVLTYDPKKPEPERLAVKWRRDIEQNIEERRKWPQVGPHPAGDVLVAISGDRTGGRVLWTWRGPGALSMPAIADVDGDGRAEIVVQSADGVVHCLDGD
jgi:hypothetical protein